MCSSIVDDLAGQMLEKSKHCGGGGVLSHTHRCNAPDPAYFTILREGCGGINARIGPIWWGG